MVCSQKKKTLDDFWQFLDDMERYKSTCKFVVCPDVYRNCIATMHWYRQFSWKIKSKGWNIAFVAQDGQERYPLPDVYDALFIGGSTEWKLSDTVKHLIRKAKNDGKWVHVGRVNTQKRIRHFQRECVNSVDGTAPIFGPDINIPLIDRQLVKFDELCRERLK